MENPMEIHEHGVGPLTLGSPLPQGVLQGAEGSYFARFVADGQAWEGFQLADPPIAVGMGAGPWLALVNKEGAAEAPLETLRPQAVAKAQAGGRLASIVVTSDRPRTKDGLGVGSTLAQIEAVRGKASLLPAPPTLGGDLCNVQVASLPGVSFVFPTCAAAREGASSIRVDLWGRRD